MRKLLLALVVCATLVSPAHADTPPTAVVIDMGFNDNLYKSNIVTEYCTIENSTCLNGKPTMEGLGAANLPTNASTTLFSHGEEVLSVMVKLNPNIKVIPIRIVGISSAGNPFIYSQAGVKSALDWVVANQAKFNIGVVNISVGGIFAGCAMPAGLSADIATLKSENVATVVATGNDSNRLSMNSPACDSNAISVGATDNPSAGVTGISWDSKAKPTIAPYSNGNAQTTVYSNGRYYVTNIAGTNVFAVGTSFASPAVATWWLTNRKATWIDTYNALISSTIPTSNQWLTGRYLFINS